MVKKIEHRKNVLTHQLQKLQKELSTLPEGQLVCYPNGKYSRWYVKTENGLRWIPKKQRDFATKLAYRKYLESRIMDLSSEYKILTTLYSDEPISKHTHATSKTQALLDNPHYAALLSDHLVNNNSKWNQWIQENYPTNPKYPEQKIHPTLSGILVRSKSEAAIERILTSHHIPFRYEPAFELSGMVVYPDFLIIHPQTEELYIWEHFGRMDDSQYAHHAFKKMELYNKTGFTPGDKLIMTFEKKTIPFSFEHAENIVWDYFLS